MDETDIKAVKGLRRFMNFVDRHQVGLTATVTFVATATAVTMMRQGNQQALIEFIEEKGLTDEFIARHPVITK